MDQEFFAFWQLCFCRICFMDRRMFKPYSSIGYEQLNVSWKICSPGLVNHRVQKITVSRRILSVGDASNLGFFLPSNDLSRLFFSLASVLASQYSDEVFSVYRCQCWMGLLSDPVCLFLMFTRLGGLVSIEEWVRMRRNLSVGESV